MKHRILVQTIPIQFKSEIRHFEIRVPDNTDRIIGVETSVRFANRLILPDETHPLFNAKFLLGEIRLQGATKNQWFYVGSVHDTDLVEHADFFMLSNNLELPFTYNSKRVKEECNAQATSTCIKGYYKDVIGQTLNQNPNYEVSLMLHIQTN